MKKIPTLFRRDPENMASVLPEVHPDCQWVLDGEGVATRKYDGVCVAMLPVVHGEVRVHGGVASSEVQEPDDLTSVWMARREVKPGKQEPPGFIAEEADSETGKTVGWEPIEQSAFAKFHREATEGMADSDWYFGTYELVGPKVNGNPERAARHLLIRHETADRLDEPQREFSALMSWLVLADGLMEGVVWHHPDGRMAKLKVRDAKAVSEGSAS